MKSVKEFEDYLKECSLNEQSYAKRTKNFKFKNEFTSMSPIWNDLINVLNRANTNVHLSFQVKLNELVQDLKKYYNHLKDKKEKIKKSEQKTRETIKIFEKFNKKLIKSKQNYYKLNQTLENHYKQLESNQKVLLKIQKLKKKLESAKQSYISNLESYNLIRKDFTKKFIDSCNLFQEEEINHLKTMRVFINTYTNLIERLNSIRMKIFTDYFQKLNNNYTIEFLYENLVFKKRSGQEEPIDAQFIKPLSPVAISPVGALNHDLTKLNINRSSFHSSQESPLLNDDNKLKNRSKFSFLKNQSDKNAAISRSNLLIVAVVSEAFDKQIEKINEFEQEKNNSKNVLKDENLMQIRSSTTALTTMTNTNKNEFFGNLDDFIENIKTKHSIRSRV